MIIVKNILLKILNGLCSKNDSALIEIRINNSRCYNWYKNFKIIKHLIEFHVARKLTLYLYLKKNFISYIS